MNQTRRFFSGRSLEQAVMAAARHYGLEPDELSYRRVEKRHGFLRSRRSVVIDVDPAGPRKPAGGREPEAAARPPAAPTSPPPSRPAPPSGSASGARPDAPAGGHSSERASSQASPSDPSRAAAEPRRPPARPAPREELDPIIAIEQAANQLLDLAGAASRARARDTGERLEVEIAGDDHELLLAEGGKGLLAIQHLLPRMLRALTGSSRFVRVDAGGFQAERTARLQEMAREEAEKVRRTGEPQTLPPLPPDERRIIHMALSSEPDVVTESLGRGLFKRLVIQPAGLSDAGEPHT